MIRNFFDKSEDWLEQLLSYLPEPIAALMPYTFGLVVGYSIGIILIITLWK